jgi:hypothetical protein
VSLHGRGSSMLVGDGRSSPRPSTCWPMFVSGSVVYADPWGHISGDLEGVPKLFAPGGARGPNERDATS